MKTTALLLILTLAAGAAGAAVAPRTVLLESFTNISCDGCADANDVTAQYMADHGANEVINLQYHVNWPHPADPYYLVAPTDALGRAMTYFVASTPALKTDGGGTVTASYPQLDAAVQARRALTSPLRLDVTRTLNGLDLDAQVTVTAVGAVTAAQPVLRVALAEELDVQAVPPGSNGETDFHWIMRAMLPDHAGTPLSLSEGGSVTLPFSTVLDAAWADTDLQVIAWVQDDATREVLQAATTAAPAAYALDFYAERYGLTAPADSLTRIDSYLENSGTQADTYDVHMTVEAPGDWTVSACSGAVCYPPWIRDFTVTLQPGESILLAIDVLQSTGNALGNFSMTVTSQGDGAVSATRDFAALAPGADVLYVDADDGVSYEGYFQLALELTGATVSTWDRAALGHLTAADLKHFDTVVWNAEYAMPALTAEDREALGGYLDAQGSLLLSGQDVAFDLAFTGSPDRTPETQAWYEEYTGAAFGADDSFDTTLTGVAGDPVGGGLAFAIAGGDGANNQGYPDVLIPAANARAVLEYAPGQAAAVRFLRNGAHVVTLGFGFEGIDSLPSRIALMQNVLAWFAVTGPTGIGDAPAALLRGEPTASPNPFNPAVTLAFALEAPHAVNVDLYDLRGQRVRTLAAGPLEAGEHALVWDGRADDGAELASGTYLARLRAGAETRTLKLMLAR
ncbi:MAG TPA: FlgD immunoglobulin-like domain containing protein [Candidatus Krumholzibacteria bacterium]|nr:FlgD immunoglobulin-like domain containing protein [Candidatus Krumholzibacteria bacterium]